MLPLYASFQDYAANAKKKKKKPQKKGQSGEKCCLIHGNVSVLGVSRKLDISTLNSGVLVCLFQDKQCKPSEGKCKTFKVKVMSWREERHGRKEGMD